MEKTKECPYRNKREMFEKPNSKKNGDGKLDDIHMGDCECYATIDGTLCLVDKAECKDKKSE